MQSSSTSSLIPFDNRISYIIRGLPVENNTDYRFTDIIGRTESDRKFLEQFQEIFLAAHTGNINECQKVIDEGYYDFEAVSIGRFKTETGQTLDHVSPLEIARRMNHFEIVALFKKALDDKTARASAQLANASNLLNEERLQNADAMHVQMIKRELIARAAPPVENDTVQAAVQYECVKTMNRRWLCYDMTAKDEKSKITGSLYENTIDIKHSITGQSLSISNAHQEQITGLCIQGERFFSSSEDKTLKSWDINTGTCLNTFACHTDSVECLFVQDKLLVSGSRDKTLKIWDTESANTLKTLRGHTSTVSAVAVKGKFAVSGSWDSSVRIWDMENGECLKVLKGHDHWVNTILIHNDLIFTGSDDKKIIIWDLITGQKLNTLAGHKVGILHLEIKDGILISKTRDSDEIKEWVLK